jgi:hypothetical protein
MTSAWLHARFSASKRPPLLVDADDGRDPKRLRIETGTTVSDHAVVVGVPIPCNNASSSTEVFGALVGTMAAMAGAPGAKMTVRAEGVEVSVELPSSSMEPNSLPNLFPKDEIAVRVPHHNGGTYRRIESDRSGKLIGDCGACTSKGRDIADFGPDVCNQNGRKRPKFFGALAAYKEAYATRDYGGAAAARATLEKLRTVTCPPCRKTDNTLTGEKKKCYDFWQEWKQQACAGPDGGCANKDCVERGPLAVYVIEADHTNPKEKVHKLSDYPWWARHGGIAAMRLEAEKVRMLCCFCHRLEKTGKAARRPGDPARMPTGKQGKHATKQEVAQYKAKRLATIKYPKQQYVDAEKLRRAHCLRCKRVVTKETAFAFDFDHRDPKTKMVGEDTLAGTTGGVAGLVHNNTKRASLPKIKGVIDAEATLCDLLCCNCHKRKTCGYPMRE